MARSMNGINNIEVNNIEFPDGSTISSANNLVQLDTNNNFTGNNTYNTNLPTSIVNPDVVDIGNNTILNRFSADKLYIGNGEISECFNGASITGRDLTLTRVDGENPEVIGIPETSLSTCVLLTGIQEIDGTKTFVEIPKIKIPSGGTLPTPTDNAELTTKNYVDTTAVLKTTAQEIDGEKTFVDFPKIKLTNAVPPAVPDPTANNQFATKKYVDDNAGGSTPSNMATTDTTQTISGLKSFSNQRPKALSTAINTTATATEFITKSDGDGFYAPKNPETMVKQELNHYAYDVLPGNPADTNPNQYGGAIESRLTCYVSTFNGSYSAVSLDFSVAGEWNKIEYDKGCVIARAVYVDAIPSGNYSYDKILRAPIQGTATSFIQNFNVSYHNVDRNSTMESCNGKFIDYDIEDDKLYAYTVVLVNSDANTTGVRFYLNRTVNSGTLPPYERGTSCITAMLYN